MVYHLVEGGVPATLAERLGRIRQCGLFAQISAGGLGGELALKGNRPSTASVRALCGSSTLELDRETTLKKGADGTSDLPLAGVLSLDDYIHDVEDSLDLTAAVGEQKRHGLFINDHGARAAAFFGGVDADAEGALHQ